MKRSLLTLTLILASLAPSTLLASPKGNNVLNLKESITDDAIIYPESFETDARKLLESWYMKNYTDTDDRYRSSGNPATTDAVIRQRLADMPTVIDMPFNQIVRSYIDRYMERGAACGLAARAWHLLYAHLRAGTRSRAAPSGAEVSSCHRVGPRPECRVALRGRRSVAVYASGRKRV